MAAQARIESVLAIAMLVGAMVWPLALRAEEGLCKDYGILVEGSRAEDVADACAAAGDAASFFALVGLAMPRNLLIRLVDESASPFVDEHEIGHYDGRLHAIVMRDFRAATSQRFRSDHGLGAIATRGEWRSYIVHELAHAAIHAGCDRSCPSRAIHEYVAAVAQISALSEDDRVRLLDAHREIDGFERESEITEIYYSLNPRYFAVKSYKHFQRQPNPLAFLKAFLARR